MRVAELFCGLKGWSDPFKDRGHRVWTTDIEPAFKPDLAIDVFDLNLARILNGLGGPPDIVLASPPCETFSVASIGTHWTGGRRVYEPATPAATLGMGIVRKTMSLLEGLHPRFFVVENPRGVLRKLDLIRWPIERRTTWFCHHGDTSAKPTDLWGGFPPSLVLPDVCHNRRPDHASDCCCQDHDAARRGAKTGTQGKAGAAARALIPRELALSVCLAAEHDLEGGRH